MQKTVFFLSSLLLFTSLMATDWRVLDTNLSLSLQGSNAHTVADYLFESFSLLTPAIEVGNASYFRLENNLHIFRALALTQAGTQIITTGLKYLIHRERPDRTYQPRLWNTRITPSLPSGHTASSAAYTTFISLKYPQSTPVMVGFALLSGYSQIYVGNHYIGDVLAGLLVGCLTGYLGYRLMLPEKLVLPSTPTPSLARLSLGINF